MVTPEAVPLELVPAGIGSRFLALVIDWLIQAALAMAVLLGLAPFTDGVPGGVGVAVLLVLLTLVVLGYPVILETLWRGRTVGKAALGLRVVTVEGAPIGLRHAVIRGALGLVDFPLTSGAGAVISVLCTSDNRRLGDLAAGTLVLRERSGLRSPAPVRFDVPAPLAGYASTLDVAILGAAEYRAIRTFLLRSASLRPEARHHLAVQLATPLSDRVGPRPPAGTSAEAFLVAVAAVHQARQAPHGHGQALQAPPSLDAGPTLAEGHANADGDVGRGLSGGPVAVPHEPPHEPEGFTPLG